MYTIFINYIYDEPIEWEGGDVNLPPAVKFGTVEFQIRNTLLSKSEHNYT